MVIKSNFNNINNKIKIIYDMPDLFRNRTVQQLIQQQIIDQYNTLQINAWTGDFSIEQMLWQKEVYWP